MKEYRVWSPIPRVGSRLLSLLLLACLLSSAVSVQAFSVTSFRMTNDDDPLSCTQPAAHPDPYTIYDRKAVLWVDWEAYLADTSYKYEWYNPAGQLVRTYSSSRTLDSNGCSWSTISSQNLFDGGFGVWTVKFYMDSVLQVDTTFTFSDPGAFNYMSFTPASFISGNGMLVAVHGTSYNPITYYHFFKQMAEDNGLVLLVPYFKESDWPSYQRVFSDDGRADLHLKDAIDELVIGTGADGSDLYMYGQSGGGQFVHRFMMAYPDDISKIVISAPGYWTFPRDDWEYPYGTGRTVDLPAAVTHDMDVISAVPKMVVIGELDTERTANLATSWNADLQAQNRLERSAHWVNWVNDYALQNTPAGYLPSRHEVIAGAGHSNVRSNSETVIDSFLFSPYAAPAIWGSLSINGNADSALSTQVTLTIHCKAALGCDQLAIGADINALVFQPRTWTGAVGQLQTTTVSYQLDTPGVTGYFLFAQLKDVAGTSSDLLGDFIAKDTDFDASMVWPLCGRITEDPPPGWLPGNPCPSIRFGNSAFTDAPFSSTFGPRPLGSESDRYDFHRGVDIATPTGTPIFAIATGEVEISGDNASYSDPLVKIRHYRPDTTSCSEGGGCYYSFYLHIRDEGAGSWVVDEDVTVQKGQLIAYSGASGSGFEHLHFEIRDAPASDVASAWQRDSIHPFGPMPYSAPNNTTITFNSANDTDPNAGIANLEVSSNRYDLLSVELALFDEDHEEVVQAGNTAVNGYHVEPSFFDMDSWNFEYTHKNSTSFPWASFGSGGLYECPYHADHGGSYSAHVHMDQQDPGNYLAGMFNGVHITTNKYWLINNKDYWLNLEFQKLSGPFACIEASAVFAHGDVSSEYWGDCLARPTGLLASAVSTSRIDLAWTDNTGTEDDFEIQRSLDGVDWNTLSAVIVTAGTVAYADTGLDAGTRYYYRVRARNSNETSVYSVAANAVTDFACNASKAMSANQWETFSLPCMPAVATVSAVFTAWSSTLNVNDYNNRWVVYVYENAATGGTPGYVQLAVDAVLEEGKGYFFYSLDTTTIQVSGSHNTGADIPLRSELSEGVYNLVGNPRNFSMGWPDVKVISGGEEKSLAEADPNQYDCDNGPVPATCLLWHVMNKWETNNYQPYDGLIPLVGSLDPFDAVWVRAHGSDIDLRVPTVAAAAPLSFFAIASAAPAGHDQRDNKERRLIEPWFMRLVVESGTYIDTGNWLGQTHGVVDGRDARDLEELYPFSSPYLSILFTNPLFDEVDWGYTTDFRALRSHAKGEWPFVVRASSDINVATLSWQGEESLLKTAWLVDVLNGKKIRIEPGGDYHFDLIDGERSFIFVIR